MFRVDYSRQEGTRRHAHRSGFPKNPVNPVPVILVTGFLGSGKTTCLKGLAAGHPEKRMVFLVNELADKDVDGSEFPSSKKTRSILGGSLFCECNAADFLKVLNEEVLPLHKETPLDALVIETSGMADPGAMGTLLGDAGLEGDFALRRIVAIVAPAKLAILLGNLPVIEDQIRKADTILLNKCDISTADSIRKAEASLRQLNPGATIFQTVKAVAPIDWFSGECQAPHAPLSTCEANPFTARVLQLSPGVTRELLVQWLSGLPPSVLRLKGAVLTTDGWMQVQKSHDSLDVASSDPKEASELVAIVHDRDEADLALISASLQSLSTS